MAGSDHAAAVAAGVAEAATQAAASKSNKAKDSGSSGVGASMRHLLASWPGPLGPHVGKDKLLRCAVGSLAVAMSPGLGGRCHL